MTASSSSHRRSSTSTGAAVSRYGNLRSPTGHRSRPDMAPAAVSGLLFLVFIFLDLEGVVLAQSATPPQTQVTEIAQPQFRPVRLRFPDLGREFVLLASGPEKVASSTGQTGLTVNPDKNTTSDAAVLALLRRGQRLVLVDSSHEDRPFRLANFSLVATDYGGKTLVMLDLVEQLADGSPGAVRQLQIITNDAAGGNRPGS